MGRFLSWKRHNVLKPVVPNKPGLYKFYSRDGSLLYVGHTKKLRHRVQSYYQKDDGDAHPTKGCLRPHINHYSYSIMSIIKARKIEKKLKPRAKFNFK